MQWATDLGIIWTVFFTDAAWLIVSVAINLNARAPRWAHNLLWTLSAYILVEMFLHGPMEAVAAFLMS